VNTVLYIIRNNIIWNIRTMEYKNAISHVGPTINQGLWNTEYGIRCWVLIFHRAASGSQSDDVGV
jgi:hypothetical protein